MPLPNTNSPLLAIPGNIPAADTAPTIKNMREEATVRLGTASGYAISARALIYIMVGHVDHHMASLHEEYVPGIK